MNNRKTKSANLENKKNIFLELGFIISLILVFIALEWKSHHEIKYTSVYESNYHDDELISPLQIKKKEVVPKIPQSHLVLHIVPDDLPDDLIDIDVSDLPNAPLGVWQVKKEDETPIDEHIPYYGVEKKPVFPGGEKALLQYVANHFKIPASDLAQGNGGTIYVGFTIDKQGFVVNVHILRPISDASSEEAIKVVSSMPRWEPGVQSTQKVMVDFILPIKMKLM